MTRRAATLATLVALAAALLVVSIGGMRARAAAARAQAAEETFLRVRLEAERVLALRARAQTVAAGEQPQQDVFRRVNEALAAAGLTEARVQSVNAAGDQALETDPAGGAARRVQTVRVVLEPISLDELGAFLDRWRRDQALWTVTGVDLAATTGRGSGGGTYRATLTASAVYVPEGSARSTP